MRAIPYRLILFSVIGAGVSSVNVQLVTIREFLSQFQGNEITISLTLFCWLLLAGLGSLLAKPVKRASPTFYALLLLFLAFYPLAQIILIRGFRETLFIHGTSAGFYQIFFYVLSMTSPYCLVAGFILPDALALMNVQHRRFTSGQLYFIDSLGDVTGGALFSFVLVHWLKPSAVIGTTSSLLVLVALLLLTGLKRYLLLFPGVLCTFIFYTLSLSSHFELHTLAGQYGEILRYEESPYGRIVITREGTQHTFWESGLPLFSDAETMHTEEKIHYPLSQLDRVRSVLLVSGGHDQTMEEIFKHSPDLIDYVELDPFLTRISQEMGLLKNDPRINIINTDGRLYIQSTAKKYDAVIVDLPDPSTFQINRFFTSEFFGKVKQVLAGDGVFSFGLTFSENYLSATTKQKLACVYKAAALHFRNVLVLPGGKAYFLCRDGDLWEDVPARLARKSVQTSYVSGFFHGNVTEERIRDLRGVIDQGGEINTDFEPRAVKLTLQEWFSLHGVSPNLLLLVLLGLSAVYLIFLNREEYLLFSSGLVSMGTEMLVIFSFQVLYGFIYSEVSAIITAFLAGLLPGAMLGNHVNRPRTEGLILSDLLLLCLLLLFFTWFSFFKSSLPPYAFLAYCFVFSMVCGYQFPVATELIGEGGSPIAGCLAADLIGAGLGTLTVGALLIPLWGIRWAIIFLILVKISSSMILFLHKRVSV